MKRGRRSLCLILASVMAMGLVSGCKAGGASRSASATSAVREDAGSVGCTAAAAETMAADEAGVRAGLHEDADVSDVEFNTEEYSYNPENPFMPVAGSPLSTFGADVDTASYANIRRMVLAGQRVPEDAVRLEEMLNYFCYDYPQPREGEPFSVTTMLSKCPWNEDHELLQIGLQAEKLGEDGLMPSNLVFLLDVSGSMEGPDRLDLVKRAFLMLTENLKPEDSISIVTYASDDRVVLDGATGEDKGRIMTAIENLRAGGSTAGSKGIQTAYQLAEKHYIEGGSNRVILATDGDLNVGVTSEGDLTRLIEKKKESGVFLSVLGFGTGNVKDNKMEAMADHGNGQYAYVDSIMEARKVLVEEMGGTLFTVAKDVKFQVEFNPSKVKGYRLLGYENRVMADRDFEDDTRDGGEIGAGHRVTALYELIPAGSGEDAGDIELKYQDRNGSKAEAAKDSESGSTKDSESGSAKDSESGSDSGFDNEWLTVKVRYKEPDGTESRLLEYPVKDDCYFAEMPEDMAFASCVAEAGMLLRDSRYAGDATFEDVVSRLQGLERVSRDEYSAEFLYLVKRMGK